MIYWGVIIVVGWMLNALIWGLSEDPKDKSHFGNPVVWLLAIPYIIFPMIFAVLICERVNRK